VQTEQLNRFPYHFSSHLIDVMTLVIFLIQYSAAASAVNG
jgi:hypothetical protein